MTLAPRSGFGVSDQSCRGAWMGSSRAAVPMSTAPKPRGKIHVILGCRFASLRDGVKKRLSDHVPETGAPKTVAAGRCMHGRHSRGKSLDFPAVTKTAGGNAGRFCVLCLSANAVDSRDVGQSCCLTRHPREAFSAHEAICQSYELKNAAPRQS